MLLLAIACAPAGVIQPLPNDTQILDSVDTGSPDPALSLVLNELVSSNTLSLDPQGATPDWLELYNPTDAAISLDGVSVSDDYTERTQVTLPTGLSVPAGGYLVLWLDGEGDSSEQHLALRLSSEGEAVGLFSAQDALIDWVLFPAMAQDQAWARMPDGGDFEVQDLGTPGAQNRALVREQRVLVAAGSAWAYHDSGALPADDWSQLDYDDSAWPVGPAPLGYGDAQATQVSFGDSSGSKHITTYYRLSFEMEAQPLSATLMLSRDDGGVVYLNGQEVMRSNMPQGQILSDTLAASTMSGSAESDWNSVDLPSGALQTGTNLLAVEVHQVSASSSDTTFDLELSAHVSVEP